VGNLTKNSADPDDFNRIKEIQQNNVACANIGLSDLTLSTGRTYYDRKKDICENSTHSCRYIAPKNIIDLNNSKYKYMLFTHNNNSQTNAMSHKTSLEGIFDDSLVPINTLYPDGPDQYPTMDLNLKNEIIDQMVRICKNYHPDNVEEATGELHQFLIENHIANQDIADNYSCQSVVLDSETYCKLQGLDRVCYYDTDDTYNKCKLNPNIYPVWSGQTPDAAVRLADIDICNYAGGPPTSAGSIKQKNSDYYESVKLDTDDVNQKYLKGERIINDLIHDPKLTCTSFKTPYQNREITDGSSNVGSPDFGIPVQTPDAKELCIYEEKCEDCGIRDDPIAKEMINDLNGASGNNIKEIYNNSDQTHDIKTYDIKTYENIMVSNVPLEKLEYNSGANNQRPTSTELNPLISRGVISSGDLKLINSNPLTETDFSSNLEKVSYDNYSCALKMKDNI